MKLNHSTHSPAAKLRWATFINGWGVSLILYLGFACAVFVALGDYPLLGPDHISYMVQADTIRALHPDGSYWHNLGSVHNEGVFLSYLYPYTGDHVQSMKLFLALLTVPYLLAFEWLLHCFTQSKAIAILFTLLAGFAVSFGVGSWGVTDSIAMLNRTLVMPAIFLILRFYLNNFESPWRYLSYIMLVFASILHLSAFHFLGILIVLDVWDFAITRKCRPDRMLAGFMLALVFAIVTEIGLEQTGLSPNVFGLAGFQATSAPTTASTTAPTTAPASVTASVAQQPSQAQSPSDAWRTELQLRPWRNMPLPLANWANIFSSYALIFILTLSGIMVQKRHGFSKLDQRMLAFFGAIPLVAFGPQTALWIVRGFLPLFPINMEEIRTISFIMIPSIYFTLRLFEFAIIQKGGPLWGCAVAVAFVALPLSMKSLPAGARENILLSAINFKLLDPSNPAQVQNARSALGISHDYPYYYSTLAVRRWLSENQGAYHKILSDRDELMLLNRPIVGPKQVAAAPGKVISGEESELLTKAFFDTKAALSSRDVDTVMQVGRRYGADIAVVPWKAVNALYQDSFYSVIGIKSGQDQVLVPQTGDTVSGTSLRKKK